MSEEMLNQFFDKMWRDYCQMNPHAKSVYQALTREDEIVSNDHIAFRTFSYKPICKEVLAQIFLNYGYKKCGDYTFTSKKLTAFHFEHFNKKFPKVFISQIEIPLLSEKSQEIIVNELSAVSKFHTENEDFLFNGRPWKAAYENYKLLSIESEYAAWVYAHGFRPNHFTVFVNDLKKYNDIYKLNEFLKLSGFKLNSFGGEVKGSKSDLLEQSSTMAGEIPIIFNEGVYHIPACYYEFAKRYPQKNGELYQGFVEKSADKIFESTRQLN